MLGRYRPYSIPGAVPVSVATRRWTPKAEHADAAILATFETFRKAHTAFQALSSEELDAPSEVYDKNPVIIAERSATEAMDAAPLPSTIIGAVTHLRFTLATNSPTPTEEDGLLNAPVEDLAAFARDQFDNQSTEDRGAWAALAVLADDKAFAGVDDAYQGGRDQAMLEVARAWIDRWQALGGSFGYSYPRGEEPRLMRSMVVATDLWQPTDRANPDLPTHTWLIEEKQHDGAVKVLEGLFVMVPGLKEAVSAVARELTPLSTPREGR